MRRVSVAFCIGVAVLVTAMSAQAQMGPSAPAPELKKLDFMAGTWTSEGTMNPGPGMPGGKFTLTSKAEWMDGNYFLVEHSDMDLGPMGKGKEIAILGYDPDRKVYTYNAFNSMGEAESSTGTSGTATSMISCIAIGSGKPVPACARRPRPAALCCRSRSISATTRSARSIAPSRRAWA